MDDTERQVASRHGATFRWTLDDPRKIAVGTVGANDTCTMKNISKMMTKKNLNAVLKGVIAAVPAIPYIMKPKKTPIAAYVIGGVSFAVAGGLAALFFFSPKTRTKALTAAKDGYTKVSDTISHLRPVGAIANGHISHDELSNGVSKSDYQPSTTGL